MTYLQIRCNLSWYTTVPVGKFASFCNKLSTSKNLLVIKLMFSKFRGRAYSIFFPRTLQLNDFIMIKWTFFTDRIFYKSYFFNFGMSRW